LRFPDARTPTVINALLDTGAAITILNRKYAKHLNIPKITGSKNAIPLTFATGQVVTGYIHPVRIEFLGRSMTIDVAFVPTEDTADLIGMRGFFDQMQVAFDHAVRKVYVAFN
jgi:hypothetical protein